MSIWNALTVSMQHSTLEMIDETYKTYKHNPPHLFRSNAKYFITGATCEHVHYMESDEAKDIFLNYLFKSFEHYNWKIEDWVVLDNHYHLMANAPENAETLAQVINNVHRFSSSGIKSLLESLESLECINCVDAVPTQSEHKAAPTQSEHSTTKKMFHNYWDTCITYENSYYARLHYLWYNPVKHGYVKHQLEWKYSSFYYRHQDEKEYLDKIMKLYPCDKVKVFDDF